MEYVKTLLARAQPVSGRRYYPVVWSEAQHDQLRRIASGDLSGHSPIDPALANPLLMAAKGEFDVAEAGVLATLRENQDTFKSDGETFISLAYALLVVQRLDLLAALFRDYFSFPAELSMVIGEDGPGFDGIGNGLVRWDISLKGEHTFVFDAKVLRHDQTRVDTLCLYWAFPLIRHYVMSGRIEHGSVMLNHGDVGVRPGLAYCDNRPDRFLIPDYIFVPTQGYHWVKQVYANNRIPWEQRKPVAFWRGGSTGVKHTESAWRMLERVRLCELGRTHPATGLLDVGLSNIVQFSDPAVIQEIHESGLLKERVPWENWGQYKYQIDIDGNSSPWSNLIQRLLTGSPVLKVTSSRGLMQWFYSELIPWHNFVPVSSDMGDLLDKVKWLERNPAVAQLIGRNGQAFAEAMTFEREATRAIPVISAAFRFFRDQAPAELPFGMPLAPSYNFYDSAKSAWLPVDDSSPSPAEPTAALMPAPATSNNIGGIAAPPIAGVHTKGPTMTPDPDLLTRKREIEARFVTNDDTHFLGEYMGILKRMARDYCGIIDFRFPGVPTPLYLRLGSSDLMNFDQMFLMKEYGFPVDIPPARILDLGAYAGYAAVFLANRFPNAEIVCIEPSAANFQMLTLNTASYSRIRRMNVAAWGHNTNLDVADTTGGDWGFRLDEISGGKSGLPALSVPEILARVGWDRVDYLKCDIEGAEVSVFGETGAFIAHMVNYCTVETHDPAIPDSRSTVKAAFDDSWFTNSRSGEFEVFVRKHVNQARDRPVARASVLRPEKGVRAIKLTNVGEEHWAYAAFGDEGCQLHPANRGQPRSELATIVDLVGQTTFTSDVEVVNPMGFGVDFIVQISTEGSTEESLEARISVAAGERKHWSVPLLAPAFGSYRIALQTIMDPDGLTNHRCFANWHGPHFR